MSNSSASTARKLHLPKASELIAAHLRNQIVRRELAEGEGLAPETSLMEQFDVSRPTLREAYRILESEGLITVRRGAHGGARVHMPSAAVAAGYAALVLQADGALLSDVYQARTIIEGPVPAILAARRSADDVAVLRELNDEAAKYEDDQVGSPAFYALGAYTTVIVSGHWVNDIALCLLVAAVAGLLLGLVSGIPGLRLGGWMLAVASFFLILLVPDVVSIGQRWTGGYGGASGIPLPVLFGHQLSINEYLIVVVVITSAWLALFRNLVVSRAGDSFAVLRQSPILTSSLGISVYGTKLKAYAISGIPAAMAGALFAYLDGFVSPDSFGLTLAISVLAGTILGGSRSVYGVVLGATLLQLGPNSSTFFGNYALIFYGAFLIFAGVLLPRGVAGLVRQRTAKYLSRAVAAAPATAVLPPMPGRRLTLERVSKAFGGNNALTGVSFSAEPGQVVALIGPNGSGKTTLLNIVSGYYKADAGSVRIGETSVTHLRPHRVAAAGVARTFQTPLVASLTVRQNVTVARTRHARVSILETMLRLPRFGKVRRADREVVGGLLEALNLTRFAEDDAQSLPLGTRRLVELARAIAAQPAVLLLDEIAAGLDDREIAELSSVIRAVRDHGETVILVEHNFALVKELADLVVVLSGGKVVVVDGPEAVAEHPEVLEHYLGQRKVNTTETIAKRA